MSKSGLTRTVSVLVLASLLAIAGVGNLSAQIVDGRDRVSAFTRLPDSAVAEFKKNPQTLLTTHASAGLPLSSEIRSLVLTAPELVEAVIDVANSANDAQKSAIGAGLAEAARILASTNPEAATRIQQAVAKRDCPRGTLPKPECAGLEPLVIAFIAASNGIRTSSLGGGAGGGEGGQGGGLFGGGSGGATGGVREFRGTNGGPSAGSSFGSSNSSNTFGALGASGGGGGGLFAPNASSSSTQ
jgi:hypothetical protein